MVSIENSDYDKKYVIREKMCKICKILSRG